VQCDNTQPVLAQAVDTHWVYGLVVVCCCNQGIPRCQDARAQQEVTCCSNLGVLMCLADGHWLQPDWPSHDARAPPLRLLMAVVKSMHQIQKHAGCDMSLPTRLCKAKRCLSTAAPCCNCWSGNAS